MALFSFLPLFWGASVGTAAGELITGELLAPLKQTDEALVARRRWGVREVDGNMFQAIGQGNIKTAVDAWRDNPTATATIYGPISSWDVSKVTNMDAIFYAASSFNGDISSWDVSSVTSMQSMFYSATAFNGDLSSWDVSAVTTMYKMFTYATAFNGNLSSWDVAEVTGMRYMFYSATSFNGDLSSWDVSSVTNMDYLFASAASFNGDISSWDVSAVTDMNNMFRDAACFHGDPSIWWSSSTAGIDWLDNAGTTSSDQCPAAGSVLQALRKELQRLRKELAADIRRPSEWIKPFVLKWQRAELLARILVDDIETNPVDE